ncbi:hypothetical protein OF83DRAFT_1085841 [Amylostereum chailletii]|nr:hypothetical protein OF83DRAFT_1085841 [Amylostereum chailletii]
MSDNEQSDVPFQSWDIPDPDGALLDHELPDNQAKELLPLLPAEKDWITDHLEEFKKLTAKIYDPDHPPTKKKDAAFHERTQLVNEMTEEDRERSKNPELQCYQPALSEILKGLTAQDRADVEKHQAELNARGLPEDLKRINAHTLLSKILYETQRKVWRLCGVPLLTFGAIPGKVPGSFKVKCFEYSTACNYLDRPFTEVFPNWAYEPLDNNLLEWACACKIFRPDPKKPAQVTKSGNVKKPWLKISHKDSLPQSPDTPWTPTKPPVGEKHLWFHAYLTAELHIDADCGNTHIFWGEILKKADETFFAMSQLPADSGEIHLAVPAANRTWSLEDAEKEAEERANEADKDDEEGKHPVPPRQKKKKTKWKQISKAVVESLDEAKSSAAQGLTSGSSDPQYQSARWKMIAAGEDSEDEHDNSALMTQWPHPAWPGTTPNTVAQQPQAQFTYLWTLSDKDPYVHLVHLVSRILVHHLNTHIKTMRHRQTSDSRKTHQNHKFQPAMIELRNCVADFNEDPPTFLWQGEDKSWAGRDLFWEAMKTQSDLWRESALAPCRVSSRGTIMTSCIGKLPEYADDGKEGGWWWSEAVEVMTLATQTEIVNLEAAGIPVNASTSAIRRNPTCKAQPPPKSIHIPRLDEEHPGSPSQSGPPRPRLKPRPTGSRSMEMPRRRTDMDTLAAMDVDDFPTFDRVVMSDDDEEDVPSDIFAPLVFSETPPPANLDDPEERPKRKRKPPSRADSLYHPHVLTKPTTYKRKQRSTKVVIQPNVAAGDAGPSSLPPRPETTDLQDGGWKLLSSVVNTPRKGKRKRQE